MKHIAILIALTALGCQQMLSQDAIDATVLMHQSPGVRSGTAWLFAYDGQTAYFFTAEHVVEPDYKPLYVGGTTGDIPIGTKLTVVGTSWANDVAILRADIPDADIVPIPICSEDPRPRERLMAIGYPTSSGRDVSVNSGNVISSLTWLRTTIDGCAPGASGGPIINATSECAYSLIAKTMLHRDTGEAFDAYGPLTEVLREFAERMKIR